MTHRSYPKPGPMDASDYPLPMLAAWRALGWYDYVLIDPRPVLPEGCARVFYAGKGVEYRVMEHIWAALAAVDSSVVAEVQSALAGPDEGGGDLDVLGEAQVPAGSAVESEKIARIQAIHAAGWPVRLVIVDHQPFNEPARDAQRQAYVAERIIMDTVKLALTGSPAATLAEAGLTNLVHGQGHASGRSAVELLTLLHELSPTAAPPLPHGACLVQRGGNCRYMDRDDIVEAVSGYWGIAPEWREREMALFIVAGGVIRAVVRPLPESWYLKVGYTDEGKEWSGWGFKSEHLTELEELYVERALAATDLGYKSWPQHPWVPETHRHLHKLPVTAPQRQSSPITLEQVWAGRGLDPNCPTPGTSQLLASTGA